MVWKKENRLSANESSKVMWELVPYTRGRGVDVGCGPYKAFPHMIGVDNKKDEEMFRITMKPDLVAQADKLDMFADASMDFVYSSHTLEHIEDFQKVLREWWRVLRVDGHLVLYLPHKDLYPNKGSPDANPDHAHDFLPKDIVEAMKGIEIGRASCRERV